MGFEQHSCLCRPVVAGTRRNGKVAPAAHLQSEPSGSYTCLESRFRDTPRSGPRPGEAPTTKEVLQRRLEALATGNQDIDRAAVRTLGTHHSASPARPRRAPPAARAGSSAEGANSLRGDVLGYFMTGPDLHTEADRTWWPLLRDPLCLESSQPGLFVADDVRHGSIKRVASAVGGGAMSIALVHSTLPRSTDIASEPRARQLSVSSSPSGRESRHG